MKQYRVPTDQLCTGDVMSYGCKSHRYVAITDFEPHQSFPGWSVATYADGGRMTMEPGQMYDVWRLREGC